MKTGCSCSSSTWWHDIQKRKKNNNFFWLSRNLSNHPLCLSPHPWASAVSVYHSILHSLIPSPSWIPVPCQLLEVKAVVCIFPVLQGLEQSLVHSRLSIHNNLLARSLTHFHKPKPVPHLTLFYPRFPPRDQGQNTAMGQGKVFFSVNYKTN